MAQDIQFATITPTNHNARRDIGNVWSTASNHHAIFLRRDARGDIQYVLGFTSYHPSGTCWALGSDDRDTRVDILFSRDSSVRSYHAVMNFDIHGRFYIQVRHKGIELDGEPLSDGDTQLFGYTTQFRIGPLRYRFQFILSARHRTEFQLRKSNHITRTTGRRHPPNLITCVNPSRNDTKVGDWVMHRIAGCTPRTVVHAGSNYRTMELVAVKRIVRRTEADAEDVADEVALYQDLEPLQNRSFGRYNMRLHDVLYTSGREWSGFADEVFMLWKPLGMYTFEDLGSYGQRSELTGNTRLQLFAQIMAGLDALHRFGWLHRDIKPDNLYIVDLHRPYAVIGDFGYSRPATDNINQRCGTHGYMAPEIAREQVYGFAADVWSLGATGVFCLLEGELKWSQDTPNLFDDSDTTRCQVYRDYVERLGNTRSPVEQLLYHMLHENARDRIRLSVAMKHVAVCDLVDALRR